MADYYELLGVAAPRSADELKKAYRKRARELHPDANPDDPQAAERFKEVSKAYAVLSDDDQRARYDRFGEAGVGGQSGGPNMDDLFGKAAGWATSSTRSSAASPFGGGRRGPSGPPRGQDMEVAVAITFEQAVFGAQIPVDAAPAATLRRVRRVGRRRGHQAGHVRRVQRLGPGSARPPERARPDGLEQPVPTMWRARPGRHHAVHEVPRRRAHHGREDVHRRRAGGRRRRLDAAAHAARRGRATRRRSR